MSDAIVGEKQGPTSCEWTPLISKAFQFEEWLMIMNNMPATAGGSFTVNLLCDMQTVFATTHDLLIFSMTVMCIAASVSVLWYSRSRMVFGVECLFCREQWLFLWKITVSSGGMLVQQLNAGDLQTERAPFDSTMVYAQNKVFDQISNFYRKS